MEGNDIGLTVHKHVACMFEGLIITEQKTEERKSRFSLFRPKPVEELDEDEYVRRVMRTWRVNELPLKSLIHMTSRLGVGVEVYTYMDSLFVPHIEHWLARKGASCTVWSYVDVNDLNDDFKYNRDVHVLFTPFEEDAAVLGIRSTVVTPDKTFGI